MMGAGVEPLVEADWLHEHLEDPDLRILDATVFITPDFSTESGRAAWERGHIPGSGFADILGDLSDPAYPPFMTMAPPAEQFAVAMSRLGVWDGTRVVIYDARENMWAARVWWLLRAFGFDAAAVLDGGWTTWVAEGRPVSTDPPAHPPATFVPRPRPHLFVGKADVFAAMDDPDTVIVSALGRRSHRGEISEYGRAGHIPGARNVSAFAVIDKQTQKYLPEPVLRQRFAGILDAPQIITYCGGAIAACSDALVLHLLGHRNVAVYDGSLIEWNSDPTTPIEVGEVT